MLSTCGTLVGRRHRIQPSCSVLRLRSGSWYRLTQIMVGQNVQAAAADKRAEATFHDASATLHEVAHVQGHLAAQDELLSRIAAKVGLDPVPVIDNPELDEMANPDPEC